MIVSAAEPVATVPEGSWARTTTRIALLLVLLYTGASSVSWLRRAAQWPAHPGQDEISSYEHRFQDVRSVLPARGVVGYLGHPTKTGPTPRDSNAAALLHFRRYLLAQYALAPVVLIESIEPEYVLGNFYPEAEPPEPAGLRMIRNFGDGVVLFRRSGP